MKQDCPLTREGSLHCCPQGLIVVGKFQGLNLVYEKLLGLDFLVRVREIQVWKKHLAASSYR